MRYLRALIVLALLACASASAAADDADCKRSDADTTDDFIRSCEFRALAPSTPELAAIVAWHETLLKDDFETFLALISNPTKRSHDDLRRVFEEMKPRTPDRVLVQFERAIPNGNKQYVLMGCRFMPDFNKEVRFIAVVFVRKDHGTHHVTGGPWSAPFHMWDRCPVS